MRLVRPKNYDILFEPNFRNFTITGKERISVEVDKSTNKLVLNCSEIKIKNCFIIVKGKTLHAKSSLDEKNEELTITTKEKIKGKVDLFIDFVGILNDKLVGLYRSQYKDKQGRTKFMATT
ncbi:MAG: M1 family peptidase, partial [Nitrosopumilaceae archaeon]